MFFLVIHLYWLPEPSDAPILHLEDLHRCGQTTGPELLSALILGVKLGSPQF